MKHELLDIDHIHVFVTDREAAVAWYERVLALKPVESLRFWSKSGGPLTISNDSRSVSLALFEAESGHCRSTVAIRVNAAGFVAWREHLDSVLDSATRLADHEVSWSIYFQDPDENLFEITSYEYEELKNSL